jgi:hypothetical protein
MSPRGDTVRQVLYVTSRAFAEKRARLMRGSKRAPASRWRSAASASAWELTETNSPIAIDSALAVSGRRRLLAIALGALGALVVLGAAGAAAGGASLRRGAVRVGMGGAVAMAVTYGVGHLVGGAVG